MERSKVFYCEICGVRFELKVEPDYDDETLEREFPDSLNWIAKLDEESVDCPLCFTKLNHE
jgi:hypothetical protein